MSRDRTIRYILGPLLLSIFVIIFNFVLLWNASRKDLQTYSNVGDVLIMLLVFGVYGYSSIYFSRDKVQGPKNQDNTVPLYANNGIIFWFLSVCFFLILCYFYQIDMFLFKSHIFITFLNSITSIVFCIYLFIKGRREIKNKNLESMKEHPDSNCFYQYYRGMEFHPKFFGDVDIKQFTNCRWGMISWQILILAFSIASYRIYGLNWGILASLLLQTAYIAKFFYWEIGYFYTLDIMLDRAGHYICWGCLVMVPSLYTLTLFAMANYPPQISSWLALVCFILGGISLVLNYWVDYQKQQFQRSNGQCWIWGKPAKYIKAKYQKDERQVEGKILISGFWGIGRKMNYTFEVLLSFFWSIVGVTSGFQVMIYPTYILILLIHRIYRDEEKCEEKYGEYWNKYCKKVPYRMLPNVF